MDGPHENINDFETIGTQIGCTPSKEANYQLIFEHRMKTTRQENHSFANWPPDAAQPTLSVLDPIQRLPPEISTDIIQYTLPQVGNYSSQLLDLTAVSPIWRNFLLTTPALWSEIHLDDRQPDFLATIATFVHLSGQVALKVTIYDRSMNGWAIPLSTILPALRITSLTVLEPGGGDSRIFSAMDIFFHSVGHLQQLRSLAFLSRVISISKFLDAFDRFDLPSTVRLSGTLTMSMPPRTRSSATSGRFFDINRYNSFGPTPLAAPLFQRCELSLRWLFDSDETTVHMREDVLSQLNLSSKYVYRHAFLSEGTDLRNSNSTPASPTKLAVDAVAPECSLERFTHIIGSSLCHLSVGVAISQIDDLVNFLRLLTRLERLNLQIKASGKESTAEIAPSSIVVPQLRRLTVQFANTAAFPPQSVAEALQGLFSVLTHLYPGVESLIILVDTYTWPFFASSYMESLRRLKYLSLSPRNYGTVPRYDSQGGTETGSITLHSLEELKVGGYSRIRGIRTPNLLSLTLKPLAPIVDLEHLNISSLRKLAIHPTEEGSYALNPLDYPVLSELDLSQYGAFKQVDMLSFSSLSSIRLMTKYFTNPEGNHLCTELLHNPEGCPSLQELHFLECLEWDILFLMLERRNFGLEGVKRIHTVTLPFTPFLIYRTFTHLLAGEKTVRPPLESISLEATREVLFDPTMVLPMPKKHGFCIQQVVQRTAGAHDFPLWTPDELYPEHGYQYDTVPGDIRDWMDHRRHLVDTWKSSYQGFSQEFKRMERCR